MVESQLAIIEKRLTGIPKGKLLIQNHSPENSEIPFLSEQFASCSDGKGLVESYSVFPGISLVHNFYHANHYGFHHAPLSSVMQINHCRYGRVGWEMHDGLNIYLGPGDLSLHMMDACAESAMSLPLGYYEGIAISVDFDIFERQTPAILRDAGLDGIQLYQKFCNQGKHTAMPASAQIDHIFSELYTLPPHMQIPYFKLKVQELLLFLSMMDPEKELDQYFSEQVEIIKAIHAQLTQHLDRRYTITELSKQHLINTSSLKAIFKSVYGASIASYMKEYRMRQAARLLRDTKDTMAEIAEQTGYESQSKFTAAFKDIFQMPPTAYRKQHQNKAL